jgi:hypothetical protein
VGEARYLKDELLNGDCICEHVIFNRSIPRKAISQAFRVAAPFEHITFRRHSPWRKIIIVAQACLSDLNSLFRLFYSTSLREAKLLLKQFLNRRK